MFLAFITTIMTFIAIITFPYEPKVKTSITWEYHPSQNGELESYSLKVGTK